jgi:GT2 family glycosyltransferase
MCKEYRNKFESLSISLTYVENPRECSAAIARNVGVEKAKGDIIMFLDSDVVLYPNYIEEILNVLKNYPNAVGVQGWIVPIKRKRHYWLRYFLDQPIRRIFLLTSLTKNKCKFRKYPIVLTKIINCETLSGSNMTFKRNTLKKFKFAENLKGYSYMEDILFSYSIFKEHPLGLYITPYARCVHKVSSGGRASGKERDAHLNWCRKYVLTKIFGWKGTLIYYWQNIGLMVITFKSKIGNL